MIEKIQLPEAINNASMAELIRANMTIATKEKSGLADTNYPLNYRYTNKDITLSECSDNGYYFFDDKVVRVDAPTGVTNYCLYVISIGFTSVQFLYASTTICFLRIKWGIWSPWKKISFTS